MAMDQNLLIIITGVTTTSAVVYYFKNNKNKKIIEQLQKQIAIYENDIKHLEVENSSARLNPHLLKNTLNTIYSFSWQTTNAIEKLSEMLKYILNENKRKYVPLSEELEFLKAYYQVHKMKLSPLTKDKLNLDISSEANKLQIAPLLTVNFIENAFIHGDYTLPNSFLELHVSVTQNELVYQVKNTYSKAEKSTGTGIENFKTRLNLLHPGKHQVYFEQNENIFTATLKLKLNEN